MKTEIVKLNVDQYGLQESKAKEIESLYVPMINLLSAMEDEFNELVVKEVTKELIPQAKDLRLRIAKVRIEAEKTRKEAKAEYLRAGNAIQGAYNTLAYAVESKEQKLKDIELHFEKLEAERIAKLQVERVKLLSPYLSENDNTIDNINLGLMDENVWNNFLTGTKTNYEQRIEAEKQAEKERIENEMLDKKQRTREIEIAPYIQFLTENKDLRNMKDNDYLKLINSLIAAKSEYDKEQEKIRLENIRLQKEAEKKELERQAELKAIRDKAEKERIEREAKEAKEKAAHELELKKEREEKERMQAIIEAERQAELKAETDRKAKEKAALLAPDKEKLTALAKEIRNIKFPEVKSIEAINILENVQVLLTKTSKFITEKSESL